MFYLRWLVSACVLATCMRVGPQRALAQSPASGSDTPANGTEPKWTDIPVPPASGAPAAAASILPEVQFPRFTSCPIADIQLSVPELSHLKVAHDQSQLAALLDKIGARTVEIVRTTPNLVSHETVDTEQNGTTTHEDYSFLILQHALGTKSRVLDEYRVDVATGEKLQTDFIEKAAESAAAPAPPSLADVIPTAPILPHSAPAGPSSQGFVSAWLDFYPANRKQFDFRYLGQQKVGRRQTLVVAFAQKPASVQLPALVEYNQRTYRIFMQGVAWIDPNEFRIVRLRSDLLSVPGEVPLHQMSTDIHFAQMSIVDAPSPLWLPTQAVIVANLNGSVQRERHTYSNYRLFRTRSRIVPK